MNGAPAEAESESETGAAAGGAAKHRIAVIIVNWDGGTRGLEAIESHEASTLRESWLIVVDNGSQDGSDVSIERRRPDAILIRNEANRGFAAACNQGLARALDEGAEFCFLLNDDAQLASDGLQELVAAADRNPRGGLFAGKIRYPDGRLWCAGVSLGWFPNLQDLRGFGKPDRGHWDREERVDALTGCGLLIRREALEAIGLFDERFFVYVEDLDLSYRAAEAGWESVYVPSAQMTHSAGASSGGGYGAWRKRILAYNVGQFVRKHGGLKLWGAFLLFEVILWPLALLKGLFFGHARAAWAKGQGTWSAMTGRKGPGPPR